MDSFEALKYVAAKVRSSYPESAGDLLIDSFFLGRLHEAGDKEEPFLHITHKYGTHMERLPYVSKFPGIGERIPYLFGHADREQILEGIGYSIEYAMRNYEDWQCWFYDGLTVRNLSAYEAVAQLESYKKAIQSNWTVTNEPGVETCDLCKSAIVMRAGVWAEGAGCCDNCGYNLCYSCAQGFDTSGYCKRCREAEKK